MDGKPAVSSRESRRRHRALVALARGALGVRWLSRAGRWSAWYAAIGHSALLLWLSSLGEEDLSGWVIRGVGWISASAGLVALAAATDLAGRLHRDGLEALVGLRGLELRELAVARAVATISVVIRATLYPSLLLASAGLAAANTVAGGIAAGLRLIAVSVYALSFGIGMGLLARWCAALSPKHPKALFVGLLLLPELARLTAGDVPSIVHFYGRLLVEIDRLAGGIG